LSDRFGLTEEEREALLPSGSQRRTDNRVAWAISNLFQAGLLERPARGRVAISAAGRNVLTAHPDRVDMSVLRGFESCREFRSRSTSREDIPDAPVAAEPEVDTASQDLLAQAVAENRAAVEGELLRRALALSPTESPRAASLRVRAPRPIVSTHASS
jgi:restriction system protein